jgi:hypothetical protein
MRYANNRRVFAVRHAKINACFETSKPMFTYLHLHHLHPANRSLYPHPLFDCLRTSSLLQYAKRQDIPERSDRKHQIRRIFHCLNSFVVKFNLLGVNRFAMIKFYRFFLAGVSCLQKLLILMHFYTTLMT